MCRRRLRRFEFSFVSVRSLNSTPSFTFGRMNDVGLTWAHRMVKHWRSHVRIITSLSLRVSTIISGLFANGILIYCVAWICVVWWNQENSNSKSLEWNFEKFQMTSLLYVRTEHSKRYSVPSIHNANSIPEYAIRTLTSNVIDFR